MKSDLMTKVVPGWVGGFEESNPVFTYPNPNLSALPMLDNMDNIDLLQRQQDVKWPEFSWETIQGKPNSRCFQMFAPFISRLGYTDKGRVYSIICPQQGACSPALGSLNVEVTVTGQRGWVNETKRTLAADMTVVGKIWFSPSAHQKPMVKLLWSMFKECNLPFPSSKANAIKVTTHQPGNPYKAIFPVRSGTSALFTNPSFAKHPEAWAVGNVEVEIGPIEPTGNPTVDKFNELILDVFNLASGNMLQNGNILSWNVWFVEPAKVNKEEWRTHAERWRESIDTDHGSPDGSGTPARYFDGSLLKPLENGLEWEVEKIYEFLRKHL